MFCIYIPYPPPPSSENVKIYFTQEISAKYGRIRIYKIKLRSSSLSAIKSNLGREGEGVEGSFTMLMYIWEIRFF